jgi:peptidoglycan/LPS O-acetylase OafA/YrhL
MQKETVMTLITWTKRALGLIAFLMWGYVIFTISRSPAPFMEQVPYCMVSTMLIFGVLTAVYKGLDHWSLQERKD